MADEEYDDEYDDEEEEEEELLESKPEDGKTLPSVPSQKPRGRPKLNAVPPAKEPPQSEPAQQEIQQTLNAKETLMLAKYHLSRATELLNYLQ